MAYVKLDTGLLDSTLWVDRDSREIFITALLMALPVELTEPTPQIAVRSLEYTGWEVPPGWYGKVEAAGSGIARRALVDAEAGLAALERLGDPDPESRSHQWDGRRLVRVDGGFIVLNFIHYRDRDLTNNVRQQRYRERQKERKKARSVTCDNDSVTRNDNTVVSSKQEAVSIISSSSSSKLDFIEPGYEPDFDELEERITKSGGSLVSWRAELKATLDGMHGLQATPLQISEALRHFNANGAEPRLRLFLGYLRSSIAGPRESGSTAQPAGKANGFRRGGKVLAATELVQRLKKVTQPNPYGGGMGLGAGWQDGFTPAELRVIKAIGTARILNDVNEGTLVSQLAKALEEAE